MKSPHLRPTRDSFGSKDIGDRCVTITSGCGDIGSALHLREPTGRIRTTTTIGKAGNGTKDTGTATTTTMTIGETMIVDGGIAIMTIKGMSTDPAEEQLGGVVTVADFNPNFLRCHFCGCWVRPYMHARFLYVHSLGMDD